LLGGLILNLMPCVFPVLGLKILGFVEQAGNQRGRVAAHGLVFTAGVLVSF
jgi:thiol:disulfide interchange protein DsbD